MYVAYNVFLPEQSILKKNDLFTKKQGNIIRYEKMLTEQADIKNKSGYHLDEAPSDEGRVSFSCETAECHTNYPHKTKKETRAFYNMHSFRISCLTCHIDANDRNLVQLGWFDAKENRKDSGGKKDDNIRITPYITMKSTEVVVEKGIKNHDDLKNKYNIRVSKRTDLSCQNCHLKNEKLFLDLPSLGYSEDEIKILRNLNEPTMYNRKENWRYPDFL